MRRHTGRREGFEARKPRPHAQCAANRDKTADGPLRCCRACAVLNMDTLRILAGIRRGRESFNDS
ncbi:unnamed protein product, partial [Rangifer tarandus platyrhynchus]